MLSLRKIELHHDAPGLPHVLISREMLMECAKAGQLLSRAKVQADELLRLAAEQREKLLETASQDF